MRCTDGYLGGIHSYSTIADHLRQMPPQRLPGTATFKSSPVGAGGRLYLTSEQGQVFVLKAGPEFEILATNEMNEICMATPAISEGTLFFRTRDHLVAVAVSQ